jgi:hypothetical protein
MRTILVQTHNAHGNEQRISTFGREMRLNVYFKGESGIRMEPIFLRLTDDGSLRVENSNQLLLQTEGDTAQKLGYSGR